MIVFVIYWHVVFFLSKSVQYDPKKETTLAASSDDQQSLHLHYSETQKSSQPQHQVNSGQRIEFHSAYVGDKFAYISILEKWCYRIIQLTSNLWHFCKLFWGPIVYFFFFRKIQQILCRLLEQSLWMSFPSKAPMVQVHVVLLHLTENTKNKCLLRFI